MCVCVCFMSFLHFETHKLCTYICFTNFAYILFKYGNIRNLLCEGMKKNSMCKIVEQTSKPQAQDVSSIDYKGSI
jgi:hypothetical protein